MADQLAVMAEDEKRGWNAAIAEVHRLLCEAIREDKGPLWDAAGKAFTVDPDGATDAHLLFVLPDAIWKLRK